MKEWISDTLNKLQPPNLFKSKQRNLRISSWNTCLNCYRTSNTLKGLWEPAVSHFPIYAMITQVFILQLVEMYICFMQFVLYFTKKKRLNNLRGTYDWRKARLSPFPTYRQTYCEPLEDPHRLQTFVQPNEIDVGSLTLQGHEPPPLSAVFLIRSPSP